MQLAGNRGVGRFGGDKALGGGGGKRLFTNNRLSTYFIIFYYCFAINQIIVIKIFSSKFPNLCFCFEYIQSSRGLKMISNSLPLLNYPFYNLIYIDFIFIILSPHFHCSIRKYYPLYKMIYVQFGIDLLFNPRKTGLFWRLVRRGGGMMPPPPPPPHPPEILAVKICTMVVCDVIYKTIYLEFQQQNFLLILIN